VIVIDRVVGPWGHQLRWQAFSVRVPEADVELAIPPARIRQMQRMIANVWRRFAWLSHPEIYKQVRKEVRKNAAIVRDQKQQETSRQVWHELAPGAWRDDAFHTIVQWLHHKLEQRREGGGGFGGGGGAGGSAAAADSIEQ